MINDFVPKSPILEIDFEYFLRALEVRFMSKILTIWLDLHAKKD